MIIEHYFESRDFKVFISQQLLDKMHEIAAKFAPREFGGILTGYLYPQHMAIVDIEVPDFYQSKYNQFIRHAGSLNHYLKNIYTRSSGKLVYLGEWHSHPNSYPKYSNEDSKSMIDIASDSKVKIKNPIMVIISMLGNVKTHKVYQVNNSELIEHSRIKYL